MENKDKVIQYRVDAETGECVGDICEGDKIVRKKQTEYQLHMVRSFDAHSKYTKIYESSCYGVKIELTKAEIELIEQITPFISYGDNYLRFCGKMVDGQEIANILDRSYETVRKLLASLIKKHILSIGEETDLSKRGFIFNPYIRAKGNVMEKKSIDCFTKYGWNYDS